MKSNSSLKNSESIVYEYRTSNSIDEKDIYNFLIEINNDFVPPLSDRLDIFEYSLKIKEKSHLIIAYEYSTFKIRGIIAFYANDKTEKKAYITIIGVTNDLRGQGVGTNLLKKAIEYSKSYGFKTIFLETLEYGPARILYEKNGFDFSDRVPVDKSGARKIVMKLNLSSISKFDFNPTNIDYKQQISKELNINLFCKRDDLFAFTGGGNKARKLQYILAQAKEQGYNAIVTAGGNQSNHLRAVAIFAAQLGWKAILIVHDSKPNGLYSGNLKLSELVGAEIRFIDKKHVSESMDKAMNDLKAEGFNPLYIWGGGHSIEGSYAYYEAVKELKSQISNEAIDYILLASGTGTTQAGIEVGCKIFYPTCKVIGVSISRDSETGKKAILESMTQLNGFLGNPIDIPEDIFFDDNWRGEGYEDVYPDLIETIKWAAKTEGLILDPTYTGKAFHALRNYVSKGVIPQNSNVVFWHTGGLLNLMASDVI